MSEQLTLPAEARDRAGKGASRALRRDGRVPAVVYGDKKEPLSVHVEEKLLTKMLNTGHFMNSVVMVEVGGKKNRTLPKAVDFHPVTSRPIHVDFLRIGEHSQVNVNVPVRFDNEEASPGLKRGGVLNIVVHDLALICDASEIPDEIHIDLTGLEKELLAHFEQPKDAANELLVRLGQEFPSHVYLDDEALREALGLPPSAVALFRFSTFDMPADKVDDSLDFLAMIVALRDRRPIRRLPQNVHPLQGLTTSNF